MSEALAARALCTLQPLSRISLACQSQVVPTRAQKVAIEGSRLLHSQRFGHQLTFKLRVLPGEGLLLSRVVSFRNKKQQKRNVDISPRAVYATSIPVSSRGDGFIPQHEKVRKCLVFSPGKGRSTKPKAIIHFLGGAFIGKTPEVTYSHMIELLAKEGYLVVATPYNITFDHKSSTRVIHERFNACIDDLSANGFRPAGLSGADVEGLPIYGVGHSLGALMHVLVGSFCTDAGRLPQANVMVSFNNKAATGAVPFFDQLQPALRELVPLVEALPVTGIALSFLEQAQEAAARNFSQLPAEVQKGLEPLGRFSEQIIPVFSQVSNGVSDFTPTPEENRLTISRSYAIPHNLLVKYTIDTIDETDILLSLLQVRTRELGGSVEQVELSGTHATPLAPDIKWEVGAAYSPVDAVAQSLKTVALADLRATTKAISEWLDRL